MSSLNKDAMDKQIETIFEQLETELIFAVKENSYKLCLTKLEENVYEFRYTFSFLQEGDICSYQDKRGAEEILKRIC